MGISCCSCLKYTDYSIVLAENILHNVEVKLQNVLFNNIYNELNKWHISLKYNNILKKHLTLKITNILKKIKIPVLYVSNPFTKHLCQNISYVIIKLIFDESYCKKLNENNYECINISYDIPFSKIYINIETNDEEINIIKNLICTIINENDNIEILSLEETTNIVDKRMFDNNLEKIVLQSIYKISNEKMEEIITNVDKRIMYYKNNEYLRKIRNINRNTKIYNVSNL